jgi:multiple sugar transport system substrate-binding protein
MRRMVGILAALLALVAAACTSDGGGSTQPEDGDGGGGPVEIVMWHGYAGLEKRALDTLVEDYNASQTDAVVTTFQLSSNDRGLQKVLTAIAGGEPPDISYLYGSWAANIAESGSTVVLNDMIESTPDFDWEDFYPGERTAATVDGNIIGVPALVDNLAIVYNPELFDDAGVDYPSADWTWDDFRAAAQALTDPDQQQYGWAYPADATEDTVWHWDAMLWEAGGDILNADNTQAVFNSEAGVRALTVLDEMANEDQSILIDTTNTKIDDLFNNGKIGMVVTGPWALPGYTNVDYGVEIMPAFENHQTIAGPDNWVLFDNGPERVQAAWDFTTWFTAPEQLVRDSLMTGHLPTRASVTELPEYEEFPKKWPGVDVFVENLENVEKARPVVTTYPRISEAMGQAIVAVLLGEQEPQAALDEAATKVNAILAAPA